MGIGTLTVDGPPVFIQGETVFGLLKFIEAPPSTTTEEANDDLYAAHLKSIL